MRARGVVCAAAVALSLSLSGARPVHLIHILADDLGYNDVSWHNPVMKTPVLQSLQDSGVHLAGLHTWKACAPSRGSIMSGRYPFHYGFYDNQDANAYGLPTNFTTLPSLLQAAGYSTHIVGKWHLGYRSPELTPTRRGFETHFGYYQHGEDYFTHRFDDGCGAPDSGYDFNNATNLTAPADFAVPRTQVGTGGVYSAYTFTSEAQRLVRRHAATRGADAPFYLYAAFQNVHAPVEVPAVYEALYDGVIADPKRKTFAGMVSALDEAVGNLTQTLREVGMWENCLLLFNSDNGGPIGEANNFPLRGGKVRARSAAQQNPASACSPLFYSPAAPAPLPTAPCPAHAQFSYWDGGVRIQGFLSSPRRDLLPIVGGSWPGMMHTVDVMPTFLAAAGITFDPAATYHGDGDVPFDGLNVLPAIQTSGTSPRTEVVHMIDNEYNSAVCNATTGVGGQNHCGAGITLGDFKLLVGFPGNDGWPQPPEATEATASAPECGAATFLNDTCLHIFVGQLRNFTCASASSCCAACAQDVQCGSWSHKAGTNQTCYLKSVGAMHKGKPGQCTSGIKAGPPTPPPAPACDTKTGIGCPCNPPSRGCLFKLSEDPNEHHDLAADPAYAADFERLLARLTVVSRTGVIAARVMLGKAQAKADGTATCAVLNRTGFYEPYATHHPYYPYPGLR